MEMPERALVPTPFEVAVPPPPRGLSRWEEEEEEEVREEEEEKEVRDRYRSEGSKGDAESFREILWWGGNEKETRGFVGRSGVEWSGREV